MVETNPAGPAVDVKDIHAAHLSQTDQLLKAADQMVETYGEAVYTPGRGELLAYLGNYNQRLEAARDYFRAATREEVTISYASEWILDNYYILRQTMREIEEDMPAGFYRQLPKLTGTRMNGLPRIYALARSTLVTTGMQVNLTDLSRVAERIQARVMLTMGEIWALPIFLRIALIEALVEALGKIIPSRTAYSLPTGPLELDLKPDDVVAASITSLRTLATIDWKRFFESVSLVERVLRSDPVGVYGLMDFDTRNQYRASVEGLARASEKEEVEVAQQAVLMAQEAYFTTNGKEPHLPAPERAAHVGFSLIAEGRPALQQRLEARQTATERVIRALSAGEGLGYISLVVVLAALIAIVPAAYVYLQGGQAWHLAAALVLTIIPALTGANAVTNWLVTRWVPPRRLPKLEFKDEIPDAYHTLVVVPALLTSVHEVEDLARQLEMHYLRNPEPGLSFGLLTDPPDAPAEVIPEDAELVELMVKRVEELNIRYGKVNDRQPFYLFHRGRRWNPAENTWMSWERKRGKIHEFNHYLLKGDPGSFCQLVGDLDALPGTRYVISLDADTILPNGAAKKLVGTLGHPLNQSQFDRDGQVRHGYTILQPRVEISPASTQHNLFTRIFAGDTGLDLYSMAISDVYQDVFGEGIYVGKGIYDPAGFERATGKRIPENQVLSHDLLEGLLGRAGLSSDISLVEEFPSQYLTYSRRMHRWVRGDWQILPWLLPVGQQRKAPLKLIDRWKIFDNLRRSLLFPAIVLLLILGWTVLPGSPWVWTAIGLLTPAVPILTSLAQGFTQIFAGQPGKVAFRSVRLAFLRWLMAVVFGLHETLTSLDAITISLYRMLVSRRGLLEWMTAAQTNRSVSGTSLPDFVDEMRYSSVLAVLFGALIWVTQPGSLLAALPVLLSWAAAPYIAYRISQPDEARTAPLNEQDVRLLRLIARRTWAFFERFVGPVDHWLPPDNYQEFPVGTIAHRTSPTNIGLLFVSTLAAYDLGYLDQFNLITRLRSTMDSLDLLERYRGHFLNWYDTRTLQPLPQRYVSTVDSGNLAACLVLMTQACREMQGVRVFRWQRWEGALDAFGLLEETLPLLEVADTYPLITQTLERIATARQTILEKKDQPDTWFELFEEISGSTWVEITGLLSELVEKGRNQLGRETLSDLLGVAERIQNHLNGTRRTIEELVAWGPLLDKIPSRLKIDFPDEIEALRTALPASPEMGSIHEIAAAGAVLTQALREQVAEPGHPMPDRDEALVWLTELESRLAASSENSRILMLGYQQLADRAADLVNEMDFRFLYNSNRRVFHIGFNLDLSVLDGNYYDLLASEARIASLIAIAKGDVHQQHWLHLGRPVTQVGDWRVLLSWSGTMFEYLMPTLFLPLYENTLLAHTAHGAVQHQIEYGQSRSSPWGISESGFYRFDPNQNYQYRAFGTPGLGFKRGLADDLVIAPYASLMAVGINPKAVVQNSRALMKLGMFGSYGFYEAVDFTPEHLSLSQKYGMVQSYMSHHQGMVMMGLVNYMKDNIMITRMQAEPRMQSVDLLLQEQIPYGAPLQSPHTADVKGTLRITAPPERIVPWAVPVYTSIPQVHLLSNGDYHLIISNTGSGFSRWKDTDLTRWRADAALDNWGNWVYLQDLDGISGRPMPWSLGFEPIPAPSAEVQVTFSGHSASFLRVQHGISARMEVIVSPDDNVEIRKIQISNQHSRPRRLRITSYGEVVLTAQENDARHPAFNKLFIESEYLPDLNLLVFRRRPRSADEEPIFFGHMLVLERKGRETRAYETNREKFLGRGGNDRSPAALTSPEYLTGSTGATLDPIFALGQVLNLPPHEGASLAYLNMAADTRAGIIELARKYRAQFQIQRSFQQAAIFGETQLRRLDLSSAELARIGQMFSALLYPLASTRAEISVIASNQRGQSALWPYGISGDYPILLVRLNDPQKLDLVREAMQAHRFWRDRKQKVDLVILNDQDTNYGAELNSMLHRLISRTRSDLWLNQRGGVYLLYSSQMNPQERIMLETAARVILDGERGSLTDQLPGYAAPVPHLPPFTGTLLASEISEPSPQLEPRGELVFWNGRGGFSPDGREYVIELGPGQSTPAPWVNVIGYPDFGFLVTESGASCTWSLNSGENRLTPWNNDPVSDPTGEALYLRDEETAEIWTPTPAPAGADMPYRVRHTAGATTFEHASHGLRHTLRVYASPNAPVKIIHLRLENVWNRHRRITATQYVEWVLGTRRQVSQQYLVPEYDAAHEALLVTNPYHPELNQRVAFLATSMNIHGLTADRREFIGRNGSLQRPAGLLRIGLESRVMPGEDPCGVLQVHIDIAAGGTEEVYFLVGQGQDREEALALVDRFHDRAEVERAWQETGEFWDRMLEGVQVQTPDRALDLMLNRWLLYQALSCRIWGRTAFYQSSGAYGFRDQLQDVMAVLMTAPEISREQILDASRHQFEEGDVLHWWHPPSGRGVRTRISDNLLWLPYVVSEYVKTTGDWTILDEKTPFLHAPPLQEGEEERYGLYPTTREEYTLDEHCRRAIERGATAGAHGIPLIGAGDWNDGMNRVGIDGRGESVWLGWFLYRVLVEYSAICEARGELNIAGRYRERAAKLSTAINRSAWDGEWFIRATYDDGSALGSSRNQECQIDSIAQSWSVLSGGTEPRRARQAMQSVLQRLVRPEDRLLLLFTPPFNKTRLDPGYIKGYVPGIRENGGQYTHAATWAVWAYTRLGLGDLAGDLYRLLNPVYQADTEQKMKKYRVEPYVIAADVYSTPPHVRRGGWTWYTGSSGWMYRLGIQAILGLHRAGDALFFDPVIPADWDGFEMQYKYGETVYQIRVENPEHVQRGVRGVWVNGERVGETSLSLTRDPGVCEVRVLMGG